MKEKLFADLGKRLLISIFAIIIIVLLILYSQNMIIKYLFFTALILLSSTALFEYIKIVERKNIFLNKKILFFFTWAISFSFFLLSFYPWLGFLPFLLFVLAVISLFIAYFTQIDGALSGLSHSVFGLVYIVFPICLLFPLIYQSQGRFFLAYLLIVTKMTDIGGYFGGKIFGKHKLAPMISPKKTVEGAFFGFIFAILSSYLFSKFFYRGAEIGALSFLALGVILATFGQIGDLAESLIKRDAKVKDSNSLPGLGGVLDTLDSLLFNIPIIYFFLQVIK